LISLDLTDQRLRREVPLPLRDRFGPVDPNPARGLEMDGRQRDAVMLWLAASGVKAMPRSSDANRDTRAVSTKTQDVAMQSRTSYRRCTLYGSRLRLIPVL
jgi:hypothetical protein